MSEDLPSGWAWSTLGEIMDGSLFSDGDWVEKKDQDPTGPVRLVQLADIGEGIFRDRSDRWLNEATAERLHCTYVQQDDILIARMPDPIGRACLMPDLGDPCVTAVDICILRPGLDVLYTRWLMWAVNSPQIRSQIETLQSGTTRKRISRKNLATVQIQLPPFAEQGRIVAAIEEHFSRLDAAETAAQTALTKLDLLRRAVLGAAFSGRHTDDWEWSTLGAVCEKPQYGWTTKSTVGKGLPYLRTSDISDGKLDWCSIPICLDKPSDLAKYRLHDEDIVVSRAGSVGVSLMIQNPPEAVFASYLIRLRVRSALPRYIGHFLKSPRYWEAISDAKAGIAVQNVNAKKLAAIQVPLPPLAEQQRIVAAIEEHFSRINAAESALQKLLDKVAALRRSILAAAFSGQLVPQDPDDEPASVLLERIVAERPKRRTRSAAPAASFGARQHS